MIYDEKTNRVRFECSGREVPAFTGQFSLGGGEAGEEPHIRYGFDGDLTQEEPDLSVAEKLEITDAMISQWTAYRKGLVE